MTAGPRTGPIGGQQSTYRPAPLARGEGMGCLWTPELLWRRRLSSIRARHMRESPSVGIRRRSMVGDSLRQVQGASVGIARRATYAQPLAGAMFRSGAGSLALCFVYSRQPLEGAPIRFGVRQSQEARFARSGALLFGSIRGACVRLRGPPSRLAPALFASLGSPRSAHRTGTCADEAVWFVAESRKWDAEGVSIVSRERPV